MTDGGATIRRLARAPWSGSRLPARPAPAGCCARTRLVLSLERKRASPSSFPPARDFASLRRARRRRRIGSVKNGSVKSGGRTGPARAGGAGAAHIVALGAIGRRDELAQRERKMRDVIPDAHRTSPCPFGCPFRLRTLLAFSRESSVNAMLIFDLGGPRAWPNRG